MISVTDEMIVYGKRYGEQSFPVTIRIEWLPDGTIRPLLYWTPDGVCYQVVSRTPGLPMAYLKDHGAGLRFKVNSVMLSEPDDDSNCATGMEGEIYLYLADNRFSQKSIVDGRYGHSGKEFIPVTLDVFPDGDYEIAILWFTGRGIR